MTGRVSTEAIQEALFDDEALAALPSWLARAAGARSAVIQWRHLDGVHEILAFNHHTPAYMALYAWKYARIDPWLGAALAAHRPGELLCVSEHVSFASFERSRFRREFLRPWGDDTLHAAVAVFDTSWGEGVMSLHRGRLEPAFAQSDFGSVSERLPQLGRVLRGRGERIARRRREQVRRDNLDGVGLGAIVVSGDGRLERVNLAADHVLRRADGFRTKDGFLSCVDPGSRLRLQAALALATAPDNPMATAISVERVYAGPKGAERETRRLAYMVSVTPAPGEGTSSQAMLVFRDPDGAEDSLGGRLRSLFRPTRLEAAFPAGPSPGLNAARAGG